MGLSFKIKVFSDVFQRWSQLPRLHSVGHRWTKHWWNDSDTGKPNCSEKTLSRCQCVYYRFPIDWPESEPGLRWWEAGDWLTARIMPRPSGMIRLVHLWTVTHVAEEFSASVLEIHRAKLIPTKLCGVTSRNEALYS